MRSILSNLILRITFPLLQDSVDDSKHFLKSFPILPVNLSLYHQNYGSKLRIWSQPAPTQHCSITHSNYLKEDMVSIL